MNPITFKGVILSDKGLINTDNVTFINDRGKEGTLIGLVSGQNLNLTNKEYKDVEKAYTKAHFGYHISFLA